MGWWDVFAPQGAPRVEYVLECEPAAGIPARQGVKRVSRLPPYPMAGEIRSSSRWRSLVRIMQQPRRKASRDVQERQPDGPYRRPPENCRQSYRDRITPDRPNEGVRFGGVAAIEGHSGQWCNHEPWKQQDDPEYEQGPGRARGLLNWSAPPPLQEDRAKIQQQRPYNCVAQDAPPCGSHDLGSNAEKKDGRQAARKPQKRGPTKHERETGDRSRNQNPKQSSFHC